MAIRREETTRGGASMTTTIEELVKPLFDQWLEEKLPEIRQEVLEDVKVKTQQTLFNQQDMAKRQNVSVTTFRKWREQGLPSEPTPTGGLMFDLDTVNRWKKENSIVKEL